MLNLNPRAGVTDAASTTVDFVQIIDVVRAPYPHPNLTLYSPRVRACALHLLASAGGDAAAARVLGIESLSKRGLSRVRVRGLSLSLDSCKKADFTNGF